MNKPTYYLWKADFLTEEEFIRAKNHYAKLGFRVVTYLDGSHKKDILNGIKALLQNHLNQV